VSHSMGAASSRWYVAKVAPYRVRTWISLAGVNHGSNALSAFSSAGYREIKPAFAASLDECRFQVLLNGTPAAPNDETPYGLGSDKKAVERIPADESRSVAYFTVYIEPDKWIQPASSARVDGAGGIGFLVPDGLPVLESSVGNYLFTERTNHDRLPRDEDVIRLVTAMLAARDE
jgi:hypothetical protein